MKAFFGTLLKIYCKNHLRETTAQQLHPDYVTIATPNFSCSNGVSFTHSQRHPITQLLDLPQASPSAAPGLHQWFNINPHLHMLPVELQDLPFKFLLVWQILVCFKVFSIFRFIEIPYFSYDREQNNVKSKKKPWKTINDRKYLVRN